MDTSGTVPVAQAGGSHRRSTGPLGTVVVLVALLSALTTFLVLAGLTSIAPTHNVVLTVLAINGALVLCLCAVIGANLWALYKARRSGAAAAGLHVRIVALFAGIAAIPALLIAILATVTLERGLDPWFTGYLRQLLGGAVEIATQHRDQQCRAIGRETKLMASDLNRAKVLFDADRKLFKDFMSSRALALGLPISAIIDKDRQTLERIEFKPLAGFTLPSEQDLQAAGDNEAWCLVPKGGNILRALVSLPAYEGFLVVAREVDPRAFEYPEIAQAGVQYYQVLEAKKVGVQVAFATMFALVTLILLLSAVRLGLAFADRLVQPIRRLIHATDQVAGGNFYVQVPIRKGEGDLARLAETFNKMTSELRLQHDGLNAAKEDIDSRRRFTEAVLAGVSAAVLGVDADNRITVANPSAEVLLGAGQGAFVGQPLVDVVPELEPLLAEARAAPHRLAQGQLTLRRGSHERTISVRVTAEQGSLTPDGFVVTLDDITDLVSAQRASAWADVARRIAHEIKNPLTPIQLSAERIRRKFGRVIESDRDIFEQCTDTIVRQVDDIKRMVDEFASFARMPKPAIAPDDLATAIRQVLFMMRVANADIEFVTEIPDEPVHARFDRRLVSQAVTNIIKNATESIREAPDDPGLPKRIDLCVAAHGGRITIDVMDTGKGFPVENRRKLLEPYMTTREGGTGLGLAIVGKIFEDHGGGIELLDRPDGRRGALVRLWLPEDETTDTASARQARVDGVTAH